MKKIKLISLFLSITVILSTNLHSQNFFNNLGYLNGAFGEGGDEKEICCNIDFTISNLIVDLNFNDNNRVISCKFDNLNHAKNLPNY